MSLYSAKKVNITIGRFSKELKPNESISRVEGAMIQRYMKFSVHEPQLVRTGWITIALTTTIVSTDCAMLMSKVSYYMVDLCTKLARIQMVLPQFVQFF
jgi:hypothetical protein